MYIICVCAVVPCGLGVNVSVFTWFSAYVGYDVGECPRPHA